MVRHGHGFSDGEPGHRSAKQTHAAEETRMRATESLPLDRALDPALEDAAALDAPVSALEPSIRALFGTGTRASGTAGRLAGPRGPPGADRRRARHLDLCHPARPVRGTRVLRPAKRLIGIGLLAVGPTAWTGWAEWSAAGSREKRVGLVHAAVNGLAIGIYASSWIARKRGRHRAGARLALTGAAVSGMGALPRRPPRRGTQGRQSRPGVRRGSAGGLTASSTAG